MAGIAMTADDVGLAELFIGGHAQRHAGGEFFDTRDPATGAVVGRVARCGPEDVDRAVRSAHEAFAAWGRSVPADRVTVLTQIAAALRAQAETLARMETLDNGKPLSQARGDVEISARYFEFFAGVADKLHGATIPLGPTHHAYTTNAPYGVTAHVLPWNAPLHQAARALAPALAAGNTAVAKPAEATPLSCVALARIAVECGLPPGVLNVVPGYGNEAGDALVRHPLVRKIAFTGSLTTGQHVMRAAADRVVPLTLELGGKSPNLVFADADLGAAAAGAWRAITFNAGQVCSAGSRLLVHASVHDELVDRLVQRNADASMGPGLDDPDLGPLTTRAQFDRVAGYLDLGRREGAELLSGGQLARDAALRGGFFVEPAIFVGADNGMRIAQEEIFGPVLTVIPFQDDEEAVRLANDSAYGLVAGVWTRDLGRAHAVSARLEAGTVFVNDWFAGGVQVPFGGVKESGFGREKGLEAIYQYVQTKAVTIRL